MMMKKEVIMEMSAAASRTKVFESEDYYESLKFEWLKVVIV